MTTAMLGYHRAMGWRAVLFLVLFASCTKQNPAATCGKGGQCTDPALPICDSDGSIAGTPGACLKPCVPGSIGACTGSDVALVCNATADGYDPMSCPFGCDAASQSCMTKCTSHAQCTSGICKVDGSCASDSEIVHTSPAGSPTSDCTSVAPCTLEHALSLSTPASGQYVALIAGDYTLASGQHLQGTRFLIGRGATQTTIRSGAQGPIFVLDGASDITFDSLRIADAKGTLPNKTDGIAISCPGTPTGMRTLHVIDCAFTNNGDGIDGGGIEGGPCTAEIKRSVFDGNRHGLSLTGAATVDSSSFTSNLDVGLYVSGNFAITNVLSARNNIGVEIDSPTVTPTFDFNTVADNSQYGVMCEYNSLAVPIAGANNIVARNGTNIAGESTQQSNCTFPGSIVAPDVAALKFKNPETVPYDYHLSAGSTAIDAALASTLNHDIDGDARPKGAGRDVGADEAF